MNPFKRLFYILLSDNSDSKHINSAADTFAYCLMPNHFHFFIRLKELPLQGLQTLEGVEESTIEGSFSKAFSNLCNGYTQAYNKRFGRKGSLFVPRFKRKEVDSLEYSCTLIRYIHLNPVIHGFVKNPEDWIYSSYSSHISLKPTLLYRDEVISWFDDVSNFKALHKEKIPEKFILEMEF